MPIITDDLLEQHVVLLDAWVQKRRQIAVLEAECAGLLTARLVVLDAQIAELPMHRDAIERSMFAEFAAAGRLAKGAVEFAFEDVRGLAYLPAVRVSFAAGAVSAAHVREIVRASDVVREAVRTERVDAGTMALYEAAVLEVAERDSASRTRIHARQVATMLAQETVADRHARAHRERSVRVRSVGDGLAILEVLLPEALAMAIMDRLTRMARHMKSGGSDREPSFDADPMPDTAEDDELSAEDLARLFAAARDLDAHDPRGAGDVDAVADDDSVSADDACEAEEAESAGSASWMPADVEVLLAMFESNPYRPPGSEISDPPLPPDPLFDPDSPSIIHLPADDRTSDQIRADLVTDLLLTTDPSAAHGTAWENVTAHVQVTVRATTLTGDDDHAGELDGHGPLLPEMARVLAGHNTGWSRLFLSPDGMITQTDTYKPTEQMRRHLRARDQHCRFPGCRMPVHRCDIDHNHDHALGGSTALNNLAHLCKTHHALKHPSVPDEARWTASTLPDWSIRWTAPTGRTYTDLPTRRVAFV